MIIFQSVNCIAINVKHESVSKNTNLDRYFMPFFSIEYKTDVTKILQTEIPNLAKRIFVHKKGNYFLVQMLI